MDIPQLQTQRLLLRRFEDRDLAELVRLAGAREIAAGTLRIPHPYSEQDARKFIADTRERSAKGISCNFAITGRSDGALIGSIGLEFEQAHHRAELGYWIGVPHWGQGYATEAARAVLRYGFGTLGLVRICAHHLDFNTASARVLQNIGMKREGRLRQHIAKWEHQYDVEVYGALHDEFLSTKS